MTAPLSFTDRAREATLRAQLEASRLDHTHIGTEHLAVALTEVPDGVTASVLTSLGVTTARIRDRARSSVAAAERDPTTVVMLTPRMITVLLLAEEEACDLGDPEVDAEHLLLGLLRAGGGLGARMLTENGVELDAVRSAVRASRPAHPRDRFHR